MTLVIFTQDTVLVQEAGVLQQLLGPGTSHGYGDLETLATLPT